MTTNDGGSAFPKAVEYADSPPNDGMSLRDYFAAHALVMFADVQALVMFADVQTLAAVRAAASTGRLDVSEMVAGHVYEIADAMLKERAKP